MHLKGIDYTWLHWKRKSCIFDPNFNSWTFSFDKSHLGWDLHIFESFQGRGLNSVKHLVSMQRFWCVFPFSVFYFLFFPVLGFVFDIPHIFCYRASAIIQVWKISRERSLPSNSEKKNWFSTGWNVDHKNPGPNCLPNFMVDSEGLQAWDVWVSWRLDRVRGFMMLWWIPWTSHWPKLKSDDGKLTCWFYLIQGKAVILGIKPI